MADPRLPIAGPDGRLKDKHLPTRLSPSSLDTVLLGDLMLPSATGLYPSTDLTSIATSQAAPPYDPMQFISFTSGKFSETGRFVADGSVGWNRISGANVEANVTGYSIEFFHSGQDLTLHTFAYGAQDFLIEIDGMPVSRRWMHYPASPGQNFTRMQFADARTRRFRVYLGQVGFVQVLLPAVGTIYAAPRRFTLAAIGDSYIQGAIGTTEGDITAGALAGQLARKTGWGVLNYGQGGTGYRNPGTGTLVAPGPGGVNVYGSAARINAYINGPKPDLALIFGGANDGDKNTYSVASVVAAAQACWTAYSAARPGVPIVVGGVESGAFDAINADLDALNTALRSAALAHPNVSGYIDMRQGELGRWVNGTGKVADPRNDGNADLFRSSDGVHPSEAGNDYVAELLVRYLRRIRVPRPA